MTPCKVSWCTQPTRTLGYCRACYSAHYKGLDPETPRRKTVHKDMTPEDRLKFWGWTVTDTGCWEYSGRKDKRGYGVLALREKRQAFAHRVAYGVWVEHLNGDMHIIHSCDNPPCINPDHLRSGTAQDNMDDKVRKGRGNTTKLTPDQVLDIYSIRRTEPVSTVADRYGVSVSSIAKIWSGKTWKALTYESI